MASARGLDAVELTDIGGRLTAGARHWSVNEALVPVAWSAGEPVAGADSMLQCGATLLRVRQLER
jgi:hypothetical protein